MQLISKTHAYETFTNRETIFSKELINELENFQTEQYSRYPLDDTLRIDLHCHDYNSDVPDELLGRILNLPETWFKI